MLFFFFICQTVDFRKVAQFNCFYVLSSKLSVVAVVCCRMFVIFIINNRYFGLVKLSVRSQELNVQRIRALFDLVGFLYGYFLSTHSNDFFETMIVSRCCLKILSSKICSYCTNGARVNKISTSGSGGDFTVLARAFLDSNSLFMLVSKNSFIL